MERGSSTGRIHVQETRAVLWPRAVKTEAGGTSGLERDGFRNGKGLAALPHENSKYSLQTAVEGKAEQDSFYSEDVFPTACGKPEALSEVCVEEGGYWVGMRGESKFNVGYVDLE